MRPAAGASGRRSQHAMTMTQQRIADGPVPAISIVLPTYRRPDRLAQALASVAAQTESDFEVVVVNNDIASAEAVDAVVARFVLPIRVIHNETNLGQSRSRNKGVEAARADLVALLDDDDTWAPEFLAKHRARHEADPGLVLVYCGHRVVWSDIPLVPRERLAPPPPADTFRALSRGDFTLPTNSVMSFKRASFLAVGGYDPAVIAFADWDFQMRLAKLGKFGHIPDALTNFGNALTGRELDPMARLREFGLLREKWGREVDLGRFQRRFTAEAYFIASFSNRFAGHGHRAAGHLMRYFFSWGSGWDLSHLARLFLLNALGPRSYARLQALANRPSDRTPDTRPGS